jgi:hypothetical protein
MKWLIDRRVGEVKKAIGNLIDECDVKVFIKDHECEGFSYFTATTIADGVKNDVKKVLETRPLEGAPNNQQ